MGLDILDAIGKLSPIFGGMAANLGKNQDTNTLLGNNAAAYRPGIVAGNLSNSRRADLMRNFKRPQLQWGGPGSVAKGMKPTVTGGPGEEGPDVHSLEDTVTQDALAQAKSNYGIKDPSAGGVGADVLGGLSTTSGILGALSKLHLGGGGSPSSGPASGPGSPGTFGKGQLAPGVASNPSATGTPFDISNQGGPTDVRAYGPDQIAQLMRLIGGVGASAYEPGGPAASAQTTGYL